MKILTVKELADKLNLKTSTIYAWVHRKKIPYVKMGGKLGFLEDKINEHILKNSYIPGDVNK